MKKMSFIFNYLTILIVLIFSSCKKDKYFNLTSTLTLETTSLTVTEGEQAIVNMSLSKKLSEDLILNFSFSVDGITNYINDDDYSKTIEVKADGSTTWASYPNDRVIFPANTISAKFRMQTTDDSKLEVVEAVTLSIEKATASSGITLENTSFSPIKITVNDNETPALNHDYDYEGGLMIFAFDEDYNPTLVSVRSTVEHPEEKAFIDAGVIPQEMLTDLQTVFKRSTTPITHYIFEYSQGGDNGAFVVPTVYIYGTEKTTDAWVMMIDAGIAYPQLASGNKEYNTNGLFGYYLFHEWGHIETLNRDTQLNSLDACNTYEEPEGCLASDSALYQFMNEFYDFPEDADAAASPKTELKTPQFVTEYAMTNNAEDIAETFAYYITQENIPTADETNSGALRKINFVKNYPAFASYRDLRDQVNTKLTAENDLPTHLNRARNGKRISCLDRKGLAEMRKSKKK